MRMLYSLLGCPPAVPFRGNANSVPFNGEALPLSCDDGAVVRHTTGVHPHGTFLSIAPSWCHVFAHTGCALSVDNLRLPKDVGYTLSPVEVSSVPFSAMHCNLSVLTMDHVTTHYRPLPCVTPPCAWLLYAPLAVVTASCTRRDA